MTGEANDYVGKGLSGGRLIVAAPPEAKQLYSQSPIVGNVACFGATSGEAYFNGLAGERFCVRNSGAKVVTEGIGDNGCEYMTAGVAVILGPTGHNFGAGMSGGIAYVYDPDHTFNERCNLEMIDLFKLNEKGDDGQLKPLIEAHLRYTGSLKAKAILANWGQEAANFVKVYPKDFRAINEAIATLKKQGTPADQLEEKAFEELVGAAPTIAK